MARQSAKQKGKKELHRFTLVGLVATGLDYLLLNLLVGVFGLPLIASNIASTTGSSYVSYMLNRKLVFKRQIHGDFRTVIMYAGTITIGILLIQTVVLSLLGNGLMQQAVEYVGVPTGWSEFIGLNLAKIVATFSAFLWNFIALRRFVFVSHDNSKN